MVTLGIDPGARYTGLAVVEGAKVLHVDVLTRLGPLDLDVDEWVRRVATEVSTLNRDLELDVIAVEGLSETGGFKKGKRDPINPWPLVVTGCVFGGIVSRFPDTVVVPPGGNGDRPAATYPAELKGRTTIGSDRIGHARSAYDVALGARLHQQVQRARRGQRRLL